MSINRKEYVRAKKLLGDTSFADVVEAIREDLELNKVEMAEKLKVSKSYYGDFTHGRVVSFSVKKAAQWAKILGYPEKVFVKLAIDDLLKRNKLQYEVQLKISNH